MHPHRPHPLVGNDGGHRGGGGIPITTQFRKKAFSTGADEEGEAQGLDLVQVVQ